MSLTSVFVVMLSCGSRKEINIEMHKLDHLYMTSSSADFSYEVIYQLLGDFTKEKRNHLKYLMAHKYLFYRQYSKVAL